MSANMKKKLNWKNLLDNKCPNCKKDLQFFPSEEMMMCTILCGFTIRKEKMQAMVAKMNGVIFIAPHRAFAEEIPALNNMGSDQIQGYEDEETVVYTK